MLRHRFRTALTFMLAGHLLITGAFGWSLHALLPHGCDHRHDHARHEHKQCSSAGYDDELATVASPTHAHGHDCCAADHRSSSAQPASSHERTAATIASETRAEFAVQPIEHDDSCSLCQFLRQLTVNVLPCDDLISTAFSSVESLHCTAVHSAPARLYAPRGPPLHRNA